MILSRARDPPLIPPRTVGRAARPRHNMIDYARPPYDQTMYDLHLPPTPPAPARLDDFQVFKKGAASYIYGNYYSNPSYDAFIEPDIDAANNVYHNLLSSRECYRDNWRNKIISHWNQEDTVSWIIDTVHSMGFTEYDIPYYNFRINGVELQEMKREHFVHRLLHPNGDPNLTGRIGDNIFDKLQSLLQQDIYRQSTVLRYAEGDSFSQEVGTVLDLDSQAHKNRLYGSDYKPNDSSLLAGACDSSDDAEYDVLRSSETASPEYYGSDGSKSGDEDDKKKMFKRAPGRPKGSGKKICKRPRSVSVPEFLRNLLLDPKYCPSIIKWEDHSLGKFRWVTSFLIHYNN